MLASGCQIRIGVKVMAVSERADGFGCVKDVAKGRDI